MVITRETDGGVIREEKGVNKGEDDGKGLKLNGKGKVTGR